MNIVDTRNIYYGHTSNLSLVCRQLAFAGIAIVWIFTAKKDSQILIPDDLIIPLVCFITALTCDLCQYFYSGVAWQIFNNCKEKEYYNVESNTFDQTAEFSAPKYINTLSLIFYYLKSLSTTLGFGFFLFFFISGKYVNFTTNGTERASEKIYKIEASKPIRIEYPKMIEKLETLSSSIEGFGQFSRSQHIEIGDPNHKCLARQMQNTPKNNENNSN